jgi:lipid A 3-O-deacylase
MPTARITTRIVSDRTATGAPLRQSLPAAASLLVLALVSVAMLTRQAAGQERTPDHPDRFLVCSAGVVDVVDPSPRPVVSLEWRFDAGPRVPSPWLAFESTAHDQFYAFGMYGDLPFAHGWVFTPSIGAAIYQENDGLALGYQLEFRTTAEVTYGRGGRRFGASFGHYSNAYLGETNRGTEFLKAVLIVPLSRGSGIADR